MKILIMGSRSYPPDIGGIERYVYEFTRVASRLGHEITLIVQKSPGEKSYEKNGNIEIIRCSVPKKKPLDRFFMTLNTVLNQCGDFDIYWGHGTPGLMLYHFKPYVFTIHGFGYMREEDRSDLANELLKWWYSWMLKKPDANIAVDRLSYEIAKKIESETYWINNGIGVYRFSRDYPNPYKKNDKRNVLYIGRLIESKGIIDIMDGFENYDDAVLHIVGGGPLKDTVRRRASDSDGSIVFHGRVETVEEYFKHADLYVLPSYHEGFPTTVLEAMAARTPTVITSLPAFDGVFEHGEETMFFSPGDVESMMEHVRNVFEDERLEQSLIEEGYKKVKKKYSWEVQTRKILKVFEKVIEGENV